MPSDEPQFLELAGPSGPRRIAVLIERHSAAAGSPATPGLVWLQGFKSDMVSTKASALSQWCRPRGLALTRFDYSGHGRSEGRFADGTLSRWLEETAAVFRQLTEGPQLLIGSSMGGHIALLLIRHLRQIAPAEAARIKGAVLIAPAWDMTEALMWAGFSSQIRAAIERDGQYLRPSRYGDAPYPITRALIEDGRNHLFAGTSFDPGCPLRILHGMQDGDVPWRHSLGLIDLLATADVRLTLIKDGEHRLSRPEDMAQMFAAIAELAASGASGAPASHPRSQT